MAGELVTGIKSQYRCPDCGYMIWITHTPDWVPSPVCPEDGCPDAPDMLRVGWEDALMPDLPTGKGVLADG